VAVIPIAVAEVATVRDNADALSTRELSDEFHKFKVTPTVLPEVFNEWVAYDIGPKPMVEDVVKGAVTAIVYAHSVELVRRTPTVAAPAPPIVGCQVAQLAAGLEVAVVNVPPTGVMIAIMSPALLAEARATPIV